LTTAAKNCGSVGAIIDGAIRDALEKIPSWSSTATAKAQTPGATFKEELDNIDAAYRKGKELLDHVHEHGHSCLYNIVLS